MEKNWDRICCHFMRHSLVGWLFKFTPDSLGLLSGRFVHVVPFRLRDSFETIHEFGRNQSINSLPLSTQHSRFSRALAAASWLCLCCWSRRVIILLKYWTRGNFLSFCRARRDRPLGYSGQPTPAERLQGFIHFFFSFHFFLYFFLLFFLLSIHSLCQFTKHDVIYLFIYLFIFIEGAGGFGAERTDDVLRRFSRACGLHSEGLQLVRWHDRTSDAALHGASAGPGASQSQRWYQRKSTCPPLSTLPLSRPISHPSSSDIAFSRDKKFIHKIREVAIGARPYRYLYNHSLVLVSSFFSTLLF